MIIAGMYKRPILLLAIPCDPAWDGVVDLWNV